MNVRVVVDVKSFLGTLVWSYIPVFIVIGMFYKTLSKDQNQEKRNRVIRFCQRNLTVGKKRV